MNFTKSYKLKIFKNNKEPVKGSKFKYPSKENNFVGTDVSELLKNNNVGILTGRINNLLCIDIDDYKSDFKFNYNNHSLDELINMTYTQRTGNGGYHLVFEYDPEIKQKQNISNDNICEVDTRSDNGYFISAGSIVNDKKYEIINNTNPIKIPASLKEFLLDNGYGANKPTPKSTSCKSTKQIVNNSLKEYHIIDSQLKYILDQKPVDYFNKVEFWKFTTCMKALNKYELWDQFNKARPKYDQEKNNVIWNNVDETKANLSVIFDDQLLHDSYFKLKKLPSSSLKNAIKINKQKLGYDFLEPNMNYVIKSDTGTGKTTSVKHYLKEHDLKFISIVSRRSLGREQHNIFNMHGLPTKYYEQEEQFNNGDNIIIQIDSLLKLKRNLDFSQYVLVLDECESILDHLVMSTTLRSTRCSVFKKFIQLLTECKNFISIDADITEKSLMFFNEFIKRDYSTYKNIYKHNKDVKAYEIADQRVMLDKIMKSDKYIICSDSKTECEKIYKYLSDSGHKNILLITSDTNDENIVFDDYDKIIFSPKIIYGIDSSIDRDVFCWYKGDTISPKKMVQQLSRARNINSIYYHFTNKKYTYNSISYKELYEINYKCVKYGLEKEGDNLLSNQFEYDPEIEDKYLFMYSKFEFDNLCFNTNKFAHFQKLLSDRGVIIKTDLFESAKENKMKLSKADALNIDEFFEIENNLKLLNLLGLTKDEAEPYFDLIKTYNFYSNHTNIKNFFFEKYDDDNYKYKINKQDDFLINVIKSNNQKLRLLKSLMEISGAKHLDKIDCKKIPSKKQIEKFKADYKIIFPKKSYSKKEFDFSTKYEINKIISEFFKILFGNIIEKKNVQKKGIRTIDYKINEDILTKHESMYNIKNDISSNNRILFLEDLDLDIN